MDIIDNEKQQCRKRENASKEIIQELSKKLKVGLGFRINLGTATREEDSRGGQGHA
jgi:hypothetical protein